MPTTRIHLGGLPIDAVTMPRAIDVIDALIAAGSGGFVVTPNVDHIVCARRDARLRAAYRDASLSLADGKPLVWMSHVLGTPLPEKVSGSDLLAPLMTMAAARGRRVFLLGSTPDTSAEAARRLTRAHAGLAIVGRDTSAWSPETGAAGDDAIFAAIANSRADLVVVALGSPKQEIFMHRAAPVLAPAVLVGLGAALDFAAGSVRRAPAWMSAGGLEWLYRLAQEPGRLAYRYLVRDLGIVPIFAADLVQRRLNPVASGERA